MKTAVTRTSTALQFALGGLNQNADMLTAAGLWDGEGGGSYGRDEKAIMSVKFSLGEHSTPYATELALAI